MSHPDYVQFEGRVEVALGDAAEMQFTLSPGMSISGQVLDEAGETRRGIVVFIRGATAENEFVRKADTSDGEGGFRIEGIAPGRYRLLAIVRGAGRVPSRRSSISRAAGMILSWFFRARGADSHGGRRRVLE